MAAFVHGALSSLHLLGIVYNGRKVALGHRKNWFDVCAHTAGLIYSTRSTFHHLRQG